MLTSSFVPEWNAKWIWKPGEIIVNDFAYFRKTFVLEDCVQSALVYVSAHNYFKLYINGIRVGGYGSPVPSNPKKSKYYLSYDVSSLLKAGKNSISAFVHYLGGSGQNYVDGFPGFILQGYIKNADGSVMTILTDETWKVANSIPYKCGTPYQQNRRISAVEEFDAKCHDPGMYLPEYDDSSWDQVVISRIEEEQWNLKPQPVPEGAVEEVIMPSPCGVQRGGCQVFDAGKIVTGWVQLDLKGIPGVSVRTRYSENLDGNGRVGHNVCNETSEYYYDVYHMKGEEREIWAPDFSYKAFRYVEIEGYPEIIEPENIKVCSAHTAIDCGGHFRCSNDLLNRIFDSCIQTQKNNMVGQLVDCPHREQAQYLADSDLQTETLSYFFTNPGLIEKVLSDFRDGQLEDGTFPFVFPSNFEHPQFNLKIPEWDLHYVTILWKLYYTSGSIDVLERYYEPARRMLMHYMGTQDRETGLIPKGGGWHISDWPYPDINQDGDFLTVQNCKIYYDLVLMGEMAGRLNKNEERQEFIRLAEQLKHSIQIHLYNREKKLFRDSYGVEEYHQGTNVVAFQYGMVPQEDRDELLNWIANQGLGTKTLLSLNLLRILFENGKGQTAYELLNSTEYPGWGHMVEKGYKTIWEGFDDKESHCHAWNAYPARLFAEYILGIKALLPGFKEVSIRPFIPEGLEFAEGEIWTTQGKVFVKWEKMSDKFTMDVRIPSSAAARISIPKLENKNGTDIRNSIEGLYEGSQIVEEDDDYITLSVQSGQYRFMI